MFLLPALFGRFLFLRFTLPLAHKLGIHPAVSSVLLVNVLMLFELALLLAAFYWVQHGRRWQQLRRATYVWPIDWKGTAWSPLLCLGIFIVLGAWGTLAQPRILAFMQGMGFWKGRNIILELNSMSPPATTVAVVLIYLSWAILGAFVEEAYFRGYLQSQMSFAGRFDWVLGGLLYGFHHFWVTPLVPTAMVLGWCLALIFKWRKNTWPCILAKFLLLGGQSIIYLSGMVKPH
jgi:membrane protease YdiL (CAAX protease family)